MTTGELEALILESAASNPVCNGLASVTVAYFDDERRRFNWAVYRADGSPGSPCDELIEAIADTLRATIDLKETPSLPGD